jgi:hypothetical protein
MAAELITPADQLTGMPLPILNPSMTRTYASPVYKADWHHSFHPSSSEILKDTPGGVALRNCRAQRVHYGVHHYDYHRIFKGPDIPQSEDEQFRLVVLAAAGYVPEEALTFDRKGNPSIIHMNAKQRERLWSEQQMKLWTPRKVRDFLQGHILSQDFSPVKQLTIEEFLTTPDEQKRWELGCTLLGYASLKATEQVKDTYKVARRETCLPPTRAQTAARFVLGAVSLKKDRAQLFSRLDDTLMAYA